MEFEPDALELIVEKAIERNTGARGLRSIIEDTMRDIMFEIPGNSKIEKCVITRKTVEGTEGPKLTINEDKQPKDTIKKKKISSTEKKDKKTAS